MTWVRRLVASMLGQMVLLSALFVGVGTYIVAVRPLLDMPRPARPDPRATTLAVASGVMRDAVRQGGDASTLTTRIESAPAIQQVQQRNPDLRYFAIAGDVRVGTAAPRYLARAGIDRMIAARRQAGGTRICTRWEQTFRRPTGLDHAGFRDCGNPRYYELRGIAVSIAVATPHPVWAYASRAWSASRGFLLPALGILAICATIMVVHIVRIRRSARLIRPPTEGQAQELSKDGLPAELLPLVRAINGMIAGSAAGEQRRRFFLSAAAHEMRTPLTVLRTRLEMLDESDDRTKLIADVRRLSRLVNDLLTLTRIGERLPTRAPTNLHAICRKAIEALDPVAMRRGVTLSLQGERDAAVVGDASMIETAVSNLIDNAIAATGPGGTVWITPSYGGWLSVRDDGAGIALDHVGEIFEPFVRLSDPPSRDGSDQPSGHGLGLAIVRAILDAHGATIDVLPGEGEGATFTIRFADEDAPSLA